MVTPRKKRPTIEGKIMRRHFYLVTLVCFSLSLTLAAPDAQGQGGQIRPFDVIEAAFHATNAYKRANENIDQFELALADMESWSGIDPVLDHFLTMAKGCLTSAIDFHELGVSASGEAGGLYSQIAGMDKSRIDYDTKKQELLDASHALHVKAKDYYNGASETIAECWNYHSQFFEYLDYILSGSNGPYY